MFEIRVKILKSINRVIIYIRNIEWRAFLNPFLQGHFMHGCAFEKAKKKDTHGFQKKKPQTFRNMSFLLVSFFYKREKYLFIFVYTFKISMFLISKSFAAKPYVPILSEISELELISVSDPFFAPKARFFMDPFLHDF